MPRMLTRSAFIRLRTNVVPANAASPSGLPRLQPAARPRVGSVPAHVGLASTRSSAARTCTRSFHQSSPLRRSLWIWCKVVIRLRERGNGLVAERSICTTNGRFCTTNGNHWPTRSLEDYGSEASHVALFRARAAQWSIVRALAKPRKLRAPRRWKRPVDQSPRPRCWPLGRGEHSRCDVAASASGYFEQRPDDIGTRHVCSARWQRRPRPRRRLPSAGAMRHSRVPASARCQPDRRARASTEQQRPRRTRAAASGVIQRPDPGRGAWLAPVRTQSYQAERRLAGQALTGFCFGDHAIVSDSCAGLVPSVRSDRGRKAGSDARLRADHRALAAWPMRQRRLSDLVGRTPRTNAAAGCSSLVGPLQRASAENAAGAQCYPLARRWCWAAAWVTVGGPRLSLAQHGGSAAVR